MLGEEMLCWEGRGRCWGQGTRGRKQHEACSQLCLPAGPNTLGFFATEGLKVHPTRSQQARGKKRTHKTYKRRSKAVRVKATVMRSPLGQGSEARPWRGAGRAAAKDVPCGSPALLPAPPPGSRSLGRGTALSLRLRLARMDGSMGS